MHLRTVARLALLSFLFAAAASGAAAPAPAAQVAKEQVQDDHKRNQDNKESDRSAATM